MDKLDEQEVKDSLKNLNGWRVEDGSLNKEFKFKDFKQAFGFMTALAEVAEEFNHHPDWSNSYNKVEISLISHDAGGLTDKDFEFARAADKAAATIDT